MLSTVTVSIICSGVAPLATCLPSSARTAATWPASRLLVSRPWSAFSARRPIARTRGSDPVRVMYAVSTCAMAKPGLSATASRRRKIGSPPKRW